MNEFVARKIGEVFSFGEKGLETLENGKQENKYYYPKYHQYYPELKKTITSKDTVYQWRRVYVRENKSKFK